MLERAAIACASDRDHSTATITAWSPPGEDAGFTPDGGASSAGGASGKPEAGSGSGLSGECPAKPPTCAGGCAEDEACVDDSCIPAVICSGDYSYRDPAALRGCTHITGTLEIFLSSATHLGELNHLISVDGTLAIIDSDDLTDLDGLANLQHVGAELVIVQNASLKDIRGLARLGPELGELTISENPLLETLDGLQGLRAVTTRPLAVNDNPKLRSVAGLCGLERVEHDVVFADGESLADLRGLEHLQVVEGELRFLRTFLENLDALRGLTRVGSALHVAYNTKLADIDGLGNLAEIGGSVQIEDNDALSTLQPLAGAAVRGTMPSYIIQCGNVPSCHAWEVMDGWIASGFTGPPNVFCNSPDRCGGNEPECRSGGAE